MQEIEDVAYYENLMKKASKDKYWNPLLKKMMKESFLVIFILIIFILNSCFFSILYHLL